MKRDKSSSRINIDLNKKKIIYIQNKQQKIEKSKAQAQWETENLLIFFRVWQFCLSVRHRIANFQSIFLLFLVQPQSPVVLLFHHRYFEFLMRHIHLLCWMKNVWMKKQMFLAGLVRLSQSRTEHDEIHRNNDKKQRWHHSGRIVRDNLSVVDFNEPNSGHWKLIKSEKKKFKLMTKKKKK